MISCAVRIKQETPPALQQEHLAVQLNFVCAQKQLAFVCAQKQMEVHMELMLRQNHLAFRLDAFFRILVTTNALRNLHLYQDGVF